MSNKFLNTKCKQTVKLYYSTLKSLVNADILIEDDNIKNTIKILSEEIDRRQELIKKTQYYSLCSNFGELDSMNGSCHYCGESNTTLFEACWRERFKS